MNTTRSPMRSFAITASRRRRRLYDVPGGIPRKHDLSFLLNQLRGNVEIPAELRRCVDALSVYGIIFRYPNEIQVDQGRARLALQYAKTVLEWVESITENR